MSKALYYLYRNLRTNSFSLTYHTKVVQHPTSIVMIDVVFNVSDKGRQRVLKERVKNVHAKLGFKSFNVIEDIDVSDKVEVYYNPYLNENFIIKDTGKAIFKVDIAYGVNNKIYI